uniref:DUF4806 domain-containing protein n=1 Tax=Heterorhabditis bacteriophora TaxID=37862 RepID=A0A1I7X2M8_HETBA
MDILQQHNLGLLDLTVSTMKEHVKFNDVDLKESINRLLLGISKKRCDYEGIRKLASPLVVKYYPIYMHGVKSLASLKVYSILD